MCVRFILLKSLGYKHISIHTVLILIQVPMYDYYDMTYSLNKSGDRRFFTRVIKEFLSLQLTL
jgi:hypothetical protein